MAPVSGDHMAIAHMNMVFYRPYYTYPSAVVIPPQPSVYIQHTTTGIQTRPAKNQLLVLFYCQEAEGYYPYVKECPRGWLQVAPRPYAQ